jgi:hypothetical protein
MACERGQEIQDAFDKAVKARIEAERKGKKLNISMPERVSESNALYRRSFHVRECWDCWNDPPKPHCRWTD